MEKFLKPTFSKLIKNDSKKNPNVATFVIEKLEQGFANTIGVALRRTILSSIPGAAVFGIDINGVQHEYQAFKDTKEDIVEIILNLKELVIEFDDNIVDFDTIYQFKISNRSGVVTADDFETPIGFKVINKDLVIANVVATSKIDIVAYVTVSRGFKSFEENRVFLKEKLSSQKNIIAIDSLFSPIKRANFLVSDVNPGESKVYERLEIVIETKGNILPEKVVAWAGSILTTYFKIFDDMKEVSIVNQFVEEIEELEEEDQLSEIIENLNLSARSENALKAAGIFTIQELVDRPVSSLQKIKNLGDKSKNEIIQSIQERGFSFKSE